MVVITVKVHCDLEIFQLLTNGCYGDEGHSLM